jgi:hypothetical protein
MEGGFQVNKKGERFSDESLGYSEQAAVVLAQSDGIAFDIFDERIAAIARQFADFRQAEAAGAVIEASTPELLAARLNVPPPALAQCLAEIEEAKRTVGPDRFSRRFARATLLAPPFKAVKVTGALFHTHGGLTVDGAARVLDTSGKPLPNRRFRTARAWLFVGQWLADRNCAWPPRRTGRGGVGAAKDAGKRLDEAATTLRHGARAPAACAPLARPPPAI